MKIVVLKVTQTNTELVSFTMCETKHVTIHQAFIQCFDNVLSFLELRKFKVDNESVENIINTSMSDSFLLSQSEYLFLDVSFLELTEPTRKFARKCDITGLGFNRGFVINDGETHIKYECDLIDFLKEKYNMSMEQAYHEEIYYYTEFEDESEYEFIYRRGELQEIKD